MRGRSSGGGCCVRGRHGREGFYLLRRDSYRYTRVRRSRRSDPSHTCRDRGMHRSSYQYHYRVRRGHARGARLYTTSRDQYMLVHCRLRFLSYLGRRGKNKTQKRVYRRMGKCKIIPLFSISSTKTLKIVCMVVAMIKSVG